MKELWGVSHPLNRGAPMPPIDDPRCYVYMVVHSRRDAEELAEHQKAYVPEEEGEPEPQFLGWLTEE